MASKQQVGNTQWYDKLHLFPADGGKPRVLLQNFDLDLGAPIWSRDGKIIYWSTGQGTKIALFGVDISSGELTTTSAPMGGANGGWQFSHDNTTWVFTHSDGAQSNDKPYLAAFPYLALPHEGFSGGHGIPTDK